MAEEDALSALRSSLQKSGLASPDTASRQSRALRKPIDTTPETFMGASVAAVSDAAEGVGEGAAAAEAAPAVAAPPRRVKRAARARGTGAGTTAALDPNLFSQFANKLAAPPSSAAIPEAGEAKDLPPSPKPAPSPLQKEPPPPPEPSPPPPAVTAEEEAAAKRASAAAIKRDSALPPIPPVVPEPAISSEAGQLSEELARLKKEREGVQEKLEDYDALCENLVPGKSAGARPLAHFISTLMEKSDQLEELQQSQTQALRELEELKQRLAQESSRNEQLSAAMVQMQEQQQQQQPPPPVVDDSKLMELQDSLLAKDGEIAQLKEQLEEQRHLAAMAIESAAAAPPAAATATTEAGAFPSREEIEKMRQQEEEAFQAAEKELAMMEALIKEQEEYLTKMEEHLGAFDFEGKDLPELQRAREQLQTLDPEGNPTAQADIADLGLGDEAAADDLPEEQ